MKQPKNAPTRPPALPVEPFAFWPKAQSRVAGLGGQAAPADPAYVFHSDYVEIGSGVVVCTLRFERLEATMGMLTVRINGRAPDPGAQAETIRTWTADLRDVAESDGVLEVSFQASAGSRYAVLGHIYEECDARARSLTAEYQLTPDAGAATGQQAVRKSLFGRRVFRRTAKMVVRARPTLADPVSQPCTPAQFDEPAYGQWTALMQQPAVQDRRQWAEVYVLQALERYGMLRPGAQGLGFAVQPWPGPAVMAARGCTVTLSGYSTRSDDRKLNQSELLSLLESSRHPTICADDVYDRQVDARAIDMNKLSGKLPQFDFAWSIGALEHLGSIEAAEAFMRNSMATLTLGGMAVHTTLLNVSSVMDTVDNASTVLFRRQDFERIAVDLVSRGHYVAQLNFDLGEPPLEPEAGGVFAPRDPELAAALDEFEAVPFALIVRRGDR